ncbi:VOC family protein [Amycolatopsis benzoatilytica]|uniref:VOC family protein n=1 Tax=Amycolatopsis benzoatilytica TaxID=346045 RepID=UPI00036557F8|nr:VOC family protein [Amycolatopsis benzoatilytica]
MNEAPVVPGSPCWLELATADPERTMRFYAELLGWDYQWVQDGEGRHYALALLDGEPVAGIRPHAGEVRDWTPYLATADLVGTAEDVLRLDGAMLDPAPREIPGVGATALADDPSGATVGLVQPAPDGSFTAGVPGSLVWLEFITRNPVRADRFYAQLFGYTQRQFGDGKNVDYVVYALGDDSVLARVRMAPDTPAEVPPRWIAHFAVQPREGLNDAVQRARAAGAKLRFRPYASTLGRVAVLSDPLGTRFALIDPELASEWEYGSAVDDPYDD